MYIPFLERLVAVDVATGSAHEIASVRACIGALVALPDGSLLVHRGFPRAFNMLPSDAAQANSFAIYTTDGTLLREIPAFAGYETETTIWGDASQVACAPVGDTCAMAGLPSPYPEAASGVHDRTLLVWRRDGSLLQSISLPLVNGIAFSPDGSRIAVGTNFVEEGYGSARIYSVADGALLAERKYTKGVF
jgi:WD40 repeat protein